MQLTFTQGLVKGQVDPIANSKLFLQKSGAFVNIYTTTVPLTAAAQHGTKTYLITEQLAVNKAWGPLPSSITSWLYWDINLATGNVTRGITNIQPLYGTSLPEVANPDQHFFDLTTKTMFVFDGTVWVENIRVFAGYVTSPGAQLVLFNFESQVGLTGDYKGGYILYGLTGKGIKDDDGTFVNTASNYMIKGGAFNYPLQFDYEPTYAIAAQPTPALSFLHFDEEGVVSLASHTAGKYATAFGLTPAVLGQELEVKFYGVIRSDQLTFKQTEINNTLWLDEAGAYTFERPAGLVAQLLGIVIDTNSFFLAPKLDMQLVGPMGVQGPTGPQGPASGPTGPQGQFGPQGVAGVTGPQGDVGPTGPIGPQGHNGIQGVQGQPGLRGVPGESITGPTGPVGAHGVTGPQGSNGPTGPQGTQGFPGPTGPQGFTGATGPAGFVGPTGPQGTPGQAGGPTGPAGIVGPMGATGDVGPTGPQGAIGLRGPTGPEGIAGVTGPTGSIGMAGPTGPGSSGNGSLSVINVGSSVLQLNLAAGEAGFQLNMLSTPITDLTIVNATTSVQSIVLFIKQLGSGHIGITWPSNIRFGPNPPDLSTTTSSYTDIIHLLTNDQGVTWFGFVAGRSM